MNSRLDFLAEIQFFEHLETFGNEVEKGLLKARRSVDAAHLRESANEGAVSFCRKARRKCLSDESVNRSDFVLLHQSMG